MGHVSTCLKRCAPFIVKSPFRCGTAFGFKFCKTCEVNLKYDGTNCPCCHNTLQWASNGKIPQQEALILLYKFLNKSITFNELRSRIYR